MKIVHLIARGDSASTRCKACGLDLSLHRGGMNFAVCTNETSWEHLYRLDPTYLRCIDSTDEEKDNENETD